MDIGFVDGGYEYAGVGTISVAGSLCADSGASRSRSLRRGMSTADEQVSLLTRVVATESSPALDVLSVETARQRASWQNTPQSARESGWPAICQANVYPSMPS